MVLVVDNYDSFTYNLLDYLRQLNVECLVVRNNITLQNMASLDFAGMVLSPGPEKPAQAGNLLDIVASYNSRIPILGICLGHQAIGMHFGARLVRAQKPMHGKISEVTFTDSPLFQNLPPKMTWHSIMHVIKKVSYALS